MTPGFKTLDEAIASAVDDARRRMRDDPDLGVVEIELATSGKRSGGELLQAIANAEELPEANVLAVGTMGGGTTILFPEGLVRIRPIPPLQEGTA